MPTEKMKGRRQLKILEIVRNNVIITQEDLARKLGEQGIDVTQATISRDIKELGLIKIPTPDGRYKYALPDEAAVAAATDRLRRLFREVCTDVDHGENIVVVKSLPGTAPAVGEALDGLGLKEIVGTVAGDNTLIAVTRSRETAVHVVEVLKELMG